MDCQNITKKIVQLLSQSEYIGYNHFNFDISNTFREKKLDVNNCSDVFHELLKHYLNLCCLEITKKKLPVSIKANYLIEFSRISQVLSEKDLSYFCVKNDLYLKDLGICRLKLIPVGSELVDEFSGIPRTILFKRGLKQLLQGALFFSFKTKGFKPFYQLHMDPRNLEEFHPEGWDKTYHRLADLLIMNPQHKGVFGASWFYDPALSDISPHLSYLRKVRQDGGAKLFAWSSSHSVVNMALEKSVNRKKMYDCGHYQPRSYFIVWERDDLINWVRKRRELYGN